MVTLSKSALALGKDQGLHFPDTSYFDLPERVLQFGTGVLLRGLPDYFIDKANKQKSFNGRIVVVKSTNRGGTDAFDEQDGLYAHWIRGLKNGEPVDELLVNASISRVLTASEEWDKVLETANSPLMEVVISNTTEVGLSFLEEDFQANPPVSFPAKLVGWLYQRFLYFKGDPSKGVVIIPTELLVDNGKLLQAICNQVAAYNQSSDSFIQWMNDACAFCDSLVDRIVPGRPSDSEQAILEERIGCTDQLSIISEPYALWAIETKKDWVKEKLSFSLVNPGVVIAADIGKFRKLKLHLLNGPHTFACGLAILCGFKTVSESLQNKAFKGYLKRLAYEEIIPALTGEGLAEAEAAAFFEAVLDRFSNPSIEHFWQNITLNYSSKMKIRNTGVLQNYYQEKATIPEAMSLSFAAMLWFVQYHREQDGRYFGRLQGQEYEIKDEQAPALQKTLEEPVEEYTNRVLRDEHLWGSDLTVLKGFPESVAKFIHLLEAGQALSILEKKLQMEESL